MALVYLSPGLYRDTVTKKIVRKGATSTSNKAAGKTKTNTGTKGTSALGQSLQGLAATGVTPSQRSITPENFAEQRAKLEQGAYDYMTADYAQRQGMQKDQLEQDLYNRGYRPDQTQTTGPGGWNAMTGELTNKWNDAYAKAKFEASQLGGQEFDRVTGLESDKIGQEIERELGLGGIATNVKSLKSNEKIAQKQLASNAAIARMQNARRSGSAAPADKGFDVI